MSWVYFSQSSSIEKFCDGVHEAGRCFRDGMKLVQRVVKNTETQCVETRVSLHGDQVHLEDRCATLELERNEAVRQIDQEISDLRGKRAEIVAMHLPDVAMNWPDCEYVPECSPHPESSESESESEADIVSKSI